MEIIKPLFDMSQHPWVTTVHLGRDSEVLGKLLRIHSKENPYILDCTYGHGKIWKGSTYRPDVSIDKRELKGITIQADFWYLPFQNGTFDVIVYDPPHLPNAADSKGASGMWRDRYGIVQEKGRREGDNICSEFYPFLTEAKRLLRKNGIVLAKIADLVHNHRYQWQQVRFITSSEEVGLTPCDMMIKVDPVAGRLKSSKWVTQKHLRKSHCYWIVARKGSCERSGYE